MTGILLVTADPELSRWAKKALAETPLRITLECAGLKETVDVFAKAPASLVILDLFVPQSSGLDVMKSLKKMDEDCLFVLLNRMRTRVSIERAYRTGAHDVLPYPLGGDVLRDTLLRRMKPPPE
jgi:DNA-binding NtrC family response regulator